MSRADILCHIEDVYNAVVNNMVSCANSYVPQYEKFFFKFWWDDELKCLKSASVNSNKLWKAAGRPRNGPIFNERQSCRLRYRRCIRDHQRSATEIYTNDLHEALLKKDGPAFWKCWRSKFNALHKCDQVDGCVDDASIVEKFMQHFAGVCKGVSDMRSLQLSDEFIMHRNNYIGTPLTNDHFFDVELVGNIIDKLERGKAAGLDSITAEHLQYSHPIVTIILTKLFNLMLDVSYIPQAFGFSYIVPIPKSKDFHTKALTVNDFRGIAISPLLSKIFELCVHDRFSDFFHSSRNQFGFKKGIGCTHATHTLHDVVDRFLSDGGTINICAIDLTKAFDKVDHYALFITLMKRHIPVNLLDILVHWFKNSLSCVKWNSMFSSFFKLEAGVRQGSVLAPYLFTIFLDDILRSFEFSREMFIIMYADDILLFAPSVCELQKLLYKCEAELTRIGMSINAKKSCCLRIGSRCAVPCANIETADGRELPWASEIRYLGIYIAQSRTFKCSLHEHKKAFYRSVNAIFGKVGRVASEEVILQLVYSKCMPVLMYGLETFQLNRSDAQSLDFTFNRFLMKLFKTSDINVINECRSYFDINLPSEILASRRSKFLHKFRCINDLTLF
jgi:hypothetical protein